MRWALAEPTTVVPMDATTAEDLVVVDALFDSLTVWDDRLRARPAAALRWESSAGGRVWQFHLRRASFHDGTPVRAEHFVDTWNTTARQGRASHHLRDVAGYADLRAGRADRLRGLTAVDDATLEVTLSRPMADYPLVVAHPALGPLPDAAHADREQPVGNGAFRMAEPWARGRFLRLLRHRAAPTRTAVGTPLDEVVFRFHDETAAYIAFEQGRVDVAPVPTGGLSRIEPTTRVVQYEGPGLLRGPLPSTYFLWFDTTKAPFDRGRVRRALSEAIDRPGMIREVFEGNATPAESLAAPPLTGAATCTACRHRPDPAERVLRREGVRRLVLWISAGGDHERVATRVRADLAHAGVRVRVRRPGFAGFQHAVRSGAASLFRFGWTLDYPVAENALRPLFHSASSTEAGGANVGRYADPRVDTLLDRAAATEDSARRAALFRAAEMIVLGRDQAIVPLVRLHRRTVIADRVLQLRYGPFGTADLEVVRVVRRVAD